MEMLMAPDEFDVYRMAAEKASEARDYAQAEKHWLAALELAESGDDENRLTATLEHLAEAFWFQNKFDLAAPVLRRLLRMYERRLGEDHFDVAIVANNMAMLYHAWGKHADAEPFYMQALEIKQRVLGKNHPETALILGNYRDLLMVLKRHDEASKLDAYETLKTSDWRRSRASLDNLPRGNS